MSMFLAMIAPVAIILMQLLLNVLCDSGQVTIAVLPALDIA
jgi:hypothetical protein